MPNHTILVVIYANIDGFPPTINAIQQLSRYYDNVIVYERNLNSKELAFEPNVQVISVGKSTTIAEAKKSSVKEKFLGYYRFLKEIRKGIKEHKPQTVLLYDMIPLALMKFVSIPANVKLWYHSHDVAHKSELPKISFQTLLKKWEIQNLKRVNIFTLPTASRMEYFPSLPTHTQYHVLPNYPSLHLYAKKYVPKNLYGKKQVKLIHQGAFIPYNFGHLLRLFNTLDLGRPLHISLAGPSVEICEKEIHKYFKPSDSRNTITALGKIAYTNLPEITQTHDIGLAMYGDHNIMVRTVSTASNKIFEYISLGLPVIFTDRQDFRELFQQYTWAHFVKSDYSNLFEIINEIINEYEAKSMAARYTFETERNYELVWKNFMESVKL